MGRYRKSIEEGTFQYRFYEALGFPPVSREGGIPLVIRITLGDMELLDGFYMPLPVDAGNLAIEDAIRKYVICESEEDRIKVKRKLSRDPNPDLLDIYDDLLYLYEQAQTGKVTLSYHVNNGASDVQPTDPVSLHQHLCTSDSPPLKKEQPPYSPFEKGDGRILVPPLEKGDGGILVPPFEKGGLGGISPESSGGQGTYRLLDLVLEVYDNLDPFFGLTDEQKDAMLKDFRCVFVLYLMDKFGYQPELQDIRHETRDMRHESLKSEVSSLESGVLSLSPADHLSSVLEYLASEDVGLICIEEEYSITPRGYDLLNSIIDEAEFYIDNYDIFGDVYVKGVSEVRFNTGYGGNLIVPVFIREGLDPYRALFIVALYLGNMDELASDLAIPSLRSRTGLFSEDLFKELFNLIACSPTEEDIGTELLDRIIREGKLRTQERQLREARLEYIESIERRINNDQ